MYRHDSRQMRIIDYTMEDYFKLDPTNRWVKRAKAVPWEMAEKKYAHMFQKNGRPAKSIRMALGALIIQQIIGMSDVETVLAIVENPYLQYFIGLGGFTNEPPFDASLMVWFRKRLSAKFMAEINDAMCKAEAQPETEEPPKDDEDEPHGGTLIVDATCVPADITYPTDTGLLADAINKTDTMIDTMQEPLRGITPRPRTYRRKSRKVFAGFIKQRRPSAKTIRKVKGKQLNFLKRNLEVIHKMRQNSGKLKLKQENLLETIEILYTQQREMHQNKTHRVEDRIVSLSQPHIRPIVRGKARTPVEFGAKVNMSVVNGYVFLNEISYDAFYEGKLLENAIQDYYVRFGMLPKKILVDQAYTDRENRKLCKELGIRLMGKPLGRPPRDATHEIDKHDVGSRNEVEGKFGTLKTRYTWDRIMARLPETGKTVISVAAFAMNLVKRAKSLLCYFCYRFLETGFTLLRAA